MRQGSDHIWAQSHIGYKRKTNQDRFLVRRLDDRKGVLLAVADGMGGEAGGDIAARMVIDDLERASIAYRASEHDLSRILAQADEKIRKRAKKAPSLEGMGTTATVVLVRQNTAYWSHAGDSRLYLFHAGSLDQISIDQTFIHDLIADGTITREEADRHPMRNVLDQCVGCGSLSVESGRCKVMEGDRVLVCSDGLFSRF